MTILFLISLAVLIVFVFLKSKQVQIVPAEILNKSDVVIKHEFDRFVTSFNNLLKRFPLLAGFLLVSLERFLETVIKQKNITLDKVGKLLKVNEIKDIRKDKGSVSLFLRSISKKDKEL